MPNLDFDMPQNQSSSIKVIGIGGDIEKNKD